MIAMASGLWAFLACLITLVVWFIFALVACIGWHLTKQFYIRSKQLEQEERRRRR